MVSFTFFLCSSLLLSGVVFADSAEDKEDETDAAVNQARKQAAIAGINVFNDVMEGRNVTDALLDRGIEALAKVDGTIPEYGKGFLEKVKEYKEGEQIEKIASSIAVAAHEKFEGKSKTIDDIYAEVGEEKVKRFVEGVTNVIKKSIKSILAKRKERKQNQKPKEEKEENQFEAAL